MHSDDTIESFVNVSQKLWNEGWPCIFEERSPHDCVLGGEELASACIAYLVVWEVESYPGQLTTKREATRPDLPFRIDYHGLSMLCWEHKARELFQQSRA